MLSADHELLEQSAPIAHRQAPELCEGCLWLHRFWPCLRLAGLAATPDRHAAFYQRAFQCAESDAQVLVSGAADQGMLACVHTALPGARVTVIDACETPLRLNRWYAERRGFEVATQRVGIFELAAANAFDLVCTHSFFGQFSREERPRLLATWQRLLRPGGRIVTAHPLRPAGADEPNRFTPRQKEVFREHLATRAEALARLLGTEPAAVLDLGERYLEARYGFPVRSGEELAVLFEGAGFDVLELTCETPPADSPPGSGGPGLRNPDVRYAHVIAQRR